MTAKKNALERYYEKEIHKQERAQRPKRKNSKPEFELRRLVMPWLRQNRFSINVIEAKATWSPEVGRYTSGQTAPGVVDLFGCTPDGLGCFIELKAPGRRATLREGQRAFLIDKIKCGCFAVCIDSVECLEIVWNEFQHRRKMDPHLAIALLLRHLPPENNIASGGLGLEDGE